MSATFTDMVQTTRRRGRPAGLLMNPVAAKRFLDGRSQLWLAGAARISAAQMSGMMAGSKGATRQTADAIADALSVEVEILFPELVQFTTEVRIFTAPKADGAAA